jgi:hypothetical protein
MLGRDLKAWRRVKAVAMRGFVLCSDGRYYHRTVSARALEVWIDKLKRRLAGGKGNQARWGCSFEPAIIRQQIAVAESMLRNLSASCPAVSRQSHEIADGSQSDRKRITGGSQANSTEGNTLSPSQASAIPLRVVGGEL